MSPDNKNRRTARWAALVFGLFFVAIGMPFVLMWMGAIVPDPRSLHAPLWVIGSAGLAFVFAGLSFALNVAGSVQTKSGALPDDAPKPLRILQDMCALGIVATFALVASWAALAPGRIKSTSTIAGVTQSTTGHSTPGRVMFGIGALICWLFLIWLARRAFRKYWPAQPTH